MWPLQIANVKATVSNFAINMNVCTLVTDYIYLRLYLHTYKDLHSMFNTRGKHPLYFFIFLYFTGGFTGGLCRTPSFRTD